MVWKEVKAKPTVYRPFEVIKRVGPVAYRVALPTKLAGVHDVFILSILGKCVHDPLHMVSYCKSKKT